jgi:mycoredoxin
MAEQSNKKIILYAHPTCPSVYPVRGMLKQAEADFEYINIYEDDAAREHVREINSGYESVPTLIFPDGSTLTEPSESQLRRKLQQMGYIVPFTAIIIGNFWKVVFIGGGVGLALLRGMGVF